jgi:hypothetical protein
VPVNARFKKLLFSFTFFFGLLGLLFLFIFLLFLEERRRSKAGAFLLLLLLWRRHLGVGGLGGVALAFRKRSVAVRLFAVVRVVT